MGKQQNSKNQIVDRDLGIRPYTFTDRAAKFLMTSMLGRDLKEIRVMGDRMETLVDSVVANFSDVSINRDLKKIAARGLRKVADFRERSDEYSHLPHFDDAMALISHLRGSLDAIAPLAVRAIDADNRSAVPGEDEFITAAVKSMSITWTAEDKGTVGRIRSDIQLLARGLPTHHKPSLFYRTDDSVESTVVTQLIRDLVDAYECGEDIDDVDIWDFQERAGKLIAVCRIFAAYGAVMLVQSFAAGNKRVMRELREREAKVRPIVEREQLARDVNRLERGKGVGAVRSVEKGAEDISAMKAELSVALEEGMVKMGDQLTAGMQVAMAELSSKLTPETFNAMFEFGKKVSSEQEDVKATDDGVLMVTADQLNNLVATKVAEALAEQKKRK